MSKHSRIPQIYWTDILDKRVMRFKSRDSERMLGKQCYRKTSWRSGGVPRLYTFRFFFLSFIFSTTGASGFFSFRGADNFFYIQKPVKKNWRVGKFFPFYNFLIISRVKFILEKKFNDALFIKKEKKRFVCLFF